MEAAADRVTGALFRKLGELEEAARGGPAPPGAVRLHRTPGAAEVSPIGGLLYRPDALMDSPLDPGLFAPSEEREFRANDPAGAARLLAELAQRGDARIRSAAMLRMGRNLWKAGRAGEALQAYSRVREGGARIVDGLPADLAGLEARCALLERMGRKEALQAEARELAAGLASGRWHLTQAAWESQREQAERWPGGLTVDAGKLALSAAASRVWSETGRGRAIWNVGRPIVAVWTEDAGVLRAVVAPVGVLDGPLGEAAPFAALLAEFAQPPEGARVERSPATTKLPWTVTVYAATAVDEFNNREWLWATGFALLVAALGAGSYVVARAVIKEMAVTRMQADFVAAVSHEFRSPLSSISQMAELMAEDRWPSEAHRRRGVEVLGRETARLRRLVEGLLEFSRMEAGNGGYRLESVDLDPLVRGVAAEFPGVTVCGEGGVALGDADALRRAVWNLVENAVKYSPDGGGVTVTMERAETRLAVRVKDEGMGIPAAELNLIFGRFYRGREAKVRQMKGTGIGLAMVKHIVEGHGGEVRVESEMGRGSTFSLLLPRREA